LHASKLSQYPENRNPYFNAYAWSAADPLVGLLALLRIPPFFPNHSRMTLYRRRLPHDYETDRPVFLTWRLHDSLPSNRSFPAAALNSGQAFAAMDRLLDEASAGPFYLRQPAVADMIVAAIMYNAGTLGHYVLHAFVVMPNHVHLLATPAVALPKLTKSLKGITSKRANEMLAMTGKSFWQEESYDHLVRHEREFEKIRNYIEENPVRAGLVREAGEYRWSSAGWATGGSPADQGVRPTIVRSGQPLQSG
jgi:putative transposase